MKRALTWVLAVAVVLAGVFGLRSVLKGRSRGALPYVTATVRRGRVDVTVSGSGTVQSATAQDVKPTVGGQVESVAVVAGQTVKAGQTIAVLKDNQGLGAAVAGARAALVAAQVKLDEMQNPSLTVQATDVQSAALAVKQAELSLSQARQGEANLTVTAPFAGQVDAVNVSVGGVVSQGTPLVTLVDTSQTDVQAQVLDAYLPEVAVGDLAAVTFPNINQTFTAEVTQIGQQPIGQGKGGNLFPVTLLLKNPPSGLADGMTANVSIDTPGLVAPSGVNASPGIGQVEATGTVTYPTVLQVTAQASGTVDTVPSVGAQVASGADLVTLHNDTLDSQLSQAELAVQSAQLNLQKLQNPQPANADDLRAQSAQVASLEADLANKEQALGDLTLVSPTDGTVTAVNVLPGDQVSSGQVVASVVNYGGLEVVAPIDEIHIAQVKVGQPTDIQVDAFPGRTFTGQVTEISPAAQVANGVSTYNVTASLAQTQGLMPGMSATLNVRVAHADNVLVVPAEAVQANGPFGFVQVLANGVVRRQPVAVGLVGTRWTQIVSGLDVGQTIVVAQASTGVTGPGGFFRLGRVAGGGGRSGGPGGPGGGD